MTVFRPFNAIEDSRLYARLEALEQEERTASRKLDGDVARLMLNVKAVVKGAGAISSRVSTHMPQYTDHGPTHLWNVLSYVEKLAGDSLQELGALECGLLIMAVFIHDLGMVPPEEEVTVWESGDADSKDARAWQTYCAGHPAWAQRERLPAAKEEQRQLLLGKVRADYLRETHADEAKALGGVQRISGWLQKLCQQDPALFRYKGLNFAEPLFLLALSHGQAVDWLPERLTHCNRLAVTREEAYHHDVGGEHVNWPYLSWLLRLADIMDFDASRTPLVVFEHLGIEDGVSMLEWEKHLAVSSVSFGEVNNEPVVRYLCNDCPSPRVEKAIRDFTGWINLELDHVRVEQGRGRRNYLDRQARLTPGLPDRAEVKINSRKNDYEYLDLSFTLERDAVMELLMGEALYGDHNLALRELVQNALDALHLRDLRSQLREKLRAAGRHTDAPPVEPVGGSEKLEVQVTWGTDEHGRSFIKVADNGVGMTRAQIEKFITRIGKSYYRSPEFKREQRLMQEHGLLCTTISQFGIGFLSSFMLADKVEVVTRAGGCSGVEAQARRIVVDGPHGLIALYPEPAFAQVSGTEVTLWLKSEFKLAPWDRQAVIDALRYQLYGSGSHISKRRLAEKALDPALELGLKVIWPLYPVQVGPWVRDDAPLVLDDDFHFRELIPLDARRVQGKALEWSVPTGELPDLTWDLATWQELPGTGSRVRYAVPRQGRSQDFAGWLQRPNVAPGTLTQTLLQALAEPQLPNKGRTRILVNGIVIPELGGLQNPLPVANGVGACCWVDLRGAAAPRLRSDRQAVTRRQPEEGELVRQTFFRHVLETLQPVTLDSWRWLAHAVAGKIPRPDLAEMETGDSWLRTLGLPPDPALWIQSLWQEWRVTKVCRRIRDTPLNRTFNRTPTRTPTRTLSRNSTITRGRAIEVSLSLSLVLASDRPSSIRINHDYARDLARAFRSETHPTSLLSSLPSIEAYGSFLEAHGLSEAFWPNVEDGLPSLAIAGTGGKLADLNLLGPIELSPTAAPLPAWLDNCGYDLISPWTGVPLGKLRAKCSAWGERRGIRALFVLPFLYGQPPFVEGYRHEIVTWLGVPDLLLWMPPPRQMGWRFEDPSHSQADWNEDSLSALWNIRQGTVVYAPGLHDRESIRSQGVTLTDLPKLLSQKSP